MTCIVWHARTAFIRCVLAPQAIGFQLDITKAVQKHRHGESSVSVFYAAESTEPRTSYMSLSLDSRIVLRSRLFSLNYAILPICLKLSLKSTLRLNFGPIFERVAYHGWLWASILWILEKSGTVLAPNKLLATLATGWAFVSSGYILAFAHPLPPSASPAQWAPVGAAKACVGAHRGRGKMASTVGNP